MGKKAIGRRGGLLQWGIDLYTIVVVVVLQRYTLPRQPASLIDIDENGSSSRLLIWEESNWEKKKRFAPIGH